MQVATHAQRRLLIVFLWLDDPNAINVLFSTTVLAVILVNKAGGGREKRSCWSQSEWPMGEEGHEQDENWSKSIAMAVDELILGMKVDDCTDNINSVIKP